MQFRETGGKVQCHAAWYDKAAKRGRQKLIYSLNRYSVNSKPSADDLRPADFGTQEERQKWAQEISDYIEKQAEITKKSRVISTVGMFHGAVKMILQDRDRTEPLLSEDQMGEIKTDFRRLAPALGLLVVEASNVIRPKPKTSRPATTPGDDTRAFSGELIEMAKAYRAEGLSIAATAERMKAEGHAVSKSWVQKWTTSA